MPHKLGWLGATLLLLVGLSVFNNMRLQLEYPTMKVESTKIERDINWSVLTPVDRRQWQLNLTRSRQRSETYLNIELPGTILWTIGWIVVFLRNIWGPRCIWLGTLFMIRADINTGSMVENILFDVVIFLFAFVLHARWSTATQTP